MRAINPKSSPLRCFVDDGGGMGTTIGGGVIGGDCAGAKELLPGLPLEEGAGGSDHHAESGEQLRLAECDVLVRGRAMLRALRPPLRGEAARAGAGDVEGFHPLDASDPDDLQRHRERDPLAAPLHQSNAPVLPGAAPLRGASGALPAGAWDPERRPGQGRRRRRRRRRGARHRRRRPADLAGGDDHV